MRLLTILLFAVVIACCTKFTLSQRHFGSSTTTTHTDTRQPAKRKARSAKREDDPAVVLVQVILEEVQVFELTQSLRLALSVDMETPERNVCSRAFFLRNTFIDNDGIGYASLNTIRDVYHPDVYFLEPALATRLTKYSGRVRYKNDTEKQVCFARYKGTYMLELPCTMDFALYPLDVQTFTLTIQSHVLRSPSGKFAWREDGAVLMRPKAQIHQYDVQTLIEECANCWNGTPSSAVGLQFQLRITRRLTHPLLSTFLPSALLVCLSCCAFWMGAQHVPERISLTVMILLALYEQMSTVRQSLPPSNSLTGGDVWMLGCFCFVFGSLAESTVVHHITASAANKTFP